MQYLVQMKLASHSRPNTPQEEAAFIETYIFPSLELCKKLEGEKKILAPFFALLFPFPMSALAAW
jgi:hypothetical protein